MSAYAQGLFGNGQGPASPLPPNTWHGSCCQLQMHEAVMKISKLHFVLSAVTLLFFYSGLNEA